jgi:hypothetical protein
MAVHLNRANFSGGNNREKRMLRYLFILPLILIGASVYAGAGSFSQMCLERSIASGSVRDTLDGPGVICYDSLILVHGKMHGSAQEKLQIRVYDLSLTLIADRQYPSQPGENCVSILQVGNYWWLLIAADRGVSSTSVYAGSSTGMGGQPSVVYFTSMNQFVPGEILGVLVLDSAFNLLTKRLVIDQLTIDAFNAALNLNSDPGTSNYPVFTGKELVWNIANELHYAGIEDPRKGKFTAEWKYTGSAAISTMNLLGVTDSIVLFMYTLKNPMQVVMQGVSRHSGRTVFQRSLTDSVGTFFPSRILSVNDGFMVAGGYVERFVGPYPFAHTETTSGATRYFGRIDGTFLARYNFNGQRESLLKSPLAPDLQHAPADKLTIRACRFALCTQLTTTPNGFAAIFEIVQSYPPYEAKGYNRVAPKRNEYYYLPLSFVNGLTSMHCDTLLNETASYYFLWDFAVPFEVNRYHWDYFSAIYPGEQSSCFRSVRSNPNKDLRFFGPDGRQPFYGYDNNPFDIQAVYADDSCVVFNFTAQDTLDQAYAFTPPFSFQYSASPRDVRISPVGGRKVITRLNQREVIVFNVKDNDQVYHLYKETL